MFRCSTDGSQQNMFTNIPMLLKGAASSLYSDQRYWHNMFHNQVLIRVDEKVFKPLFNAKNGAPNSSIRLLVGMLILKEGYGWSDNDLFENCQFNLLVRSALGLFNINDVLPAQSTYYLFRSRLLEYQKSTQKDLMQEAFQGITKGQALDFQVSGRSIRMDSKLIGSNIAWCSRYEIVHETLTKIYNAFKKEISIKLPSEALSKLKAIAQAKGCMVVYRNNREEVLKQLKELGALAYQIINALTPKDNTEYDTLKRVFTEQFKVTDSNVVELEDNENITSNSVQSPHDTDCSYRKKEEQKIKGYSANITETCDTDAPFLITDVQVEKANTSDNTYLQQAVCQTTTVLNNTPKNIHADGAYQSPENIVYCNENNINYFFNGIQGSIGRYDLVMNGTILTVTDTRTGEIIPSEKTKTGKWLIKTGNGKSRYFTQQEIDTCLLRKQIAEMPIEQRNKRNNVEAAMFQLSYRLRNNKTRYRGLIQTKQWALCRCLWINLKRIVEFTGKLCQRTIKNTIRTIKKGVFYFKKTILLVFLQNHTIIFFHFENYAIVFSK